LPADQPMHTDSITVDVGFSPFDPNQEYHDIKDVIDVQVKEKKEETWYWYAAASALLIAAIIYFLLRKKNKPVTRTPVVDSYSEAKRELEKLQKENLPAKPFYTKLIDIFRLYISRRKGIASLQKTTDDLVVQLQTLKLPAEEFNRLAQSLRLSDFVKFAKFEPAESDKSDSFKTIKDFIESMEKIEIQKEKQNQS
jgi:flagellar biosynthesis/type III secretory pathway M-ring protein FliF/YscJ